MWARTSGTLLNTTVPAEPSLAPPAQFDVLSGFESAYGAQLIGCTIKRIRGLMYVTTTSTDAFMAVRATIHVTDQLQATTAPAASDNAYGVNSQHLDYMLMEPFIPPISKDGTSADYELPAATPLAARLIDVKSQRRLSELNQSLLLRFSVRSGSPVTSVTYGWDLSILVALP